MAIALAEQTDCDAQCIALRQIGMQQLLPLLPIIGLCLGALATPAAAQVASGQAVSGQVASGQAVSEQVPSGAPALRALKELQLSIQRTTLNNGLKVVMNARPHSRTVAVCASYAVGPRNESNEQRGLAHLFEYMMFQGSENLLPLEHVTLVEGRGGAAIVRTSAERSSFCDVLPATELDLGLFLEADRMRSLRITAESFERLRRVVQDESKRRLEHGAYTRTPTRLRKFGHPVSSDEASQSPSAPPLSTITLEAAKRFHARYYAPNNAVLSITGGFDADQAMQLVRDYFTPIPRQSKVPSPAAAPWTPPAQTTESRERRREIRADTPELTNTWLIPGARTAEHRALTLLTLLLAEGDSSLLHQQLVRKLGLARSVSSWTLDHRAPARLLLFVGLRKKADFSRVQAEVDAVLKRLSQSGPARAAVERAKGQLASRFLFRLESNLSRALDLSHYELLWGDARLLTRELRNYLELAPTDLQRVSARYLTPNRRSAVEIMPVDEAEAPPAQSTHTSTLSSPGKAKR